LAGGFRNRPWVQQTIDWVKRQRLEDGGWHWKPRQKLSLGARSEAWIIAAVFSLLKRMKKGNSMYLGSILSFIESDWNTRKWSGLRFIEARIDRILNARWGGILLQALYSLASTYQNLGVSS